MILFSGNSKRDLAVIIPKAVIIVCHCPERTVHTKASFLCYADSVARKSVKVKKNFCDLKHISKTAESADFLFAVFCDTIPVVPSYFESKEAFGLKTNFHTHTFRCHHASGTDEAYVKAAISAGYQILGFADHSPWKFSSNYVSHMRMTPGKEFQDYLSSIRALKKKYSDRIDIRIGLECEYFPPYMDWLKQQIKKEKLDYIILGSHFEFSEENRYYFGHRVIDAESMDRYIKSCVDGMSTGLYAYLAHPDLFMRAYPEFDRICERGSIRLCREIKKLGYPLEYNLCGALENRRTGEECYPHHLFWQIAAAEGCDVIIGTDAHSPEALSDDTLRNEGIALLQSYGANIVDRIEYFDHR